MTHGLTIYDTLANFVDNQKNERLSTKQNTLEGHIVKVVVNLFNASVENKGYLSFHSIWNTLADDLEGKIDDNKPHVMDTSEFFRVSKHKIGYRLREVLSGKSKTVREGEEHFKAYEFNREKLSRIAKKYGYELVTKLPLSPFSEGMQGSISQSNSPKNDVAEHEEIEKKQAYTPSENRDISDIVTKDDEIFKVVTVCSLCDKPLPEDLANCTYLDGEPVHCVCANKIEAQEKKEWKCPQLTTLEGDPFCKVIKSILAKPEDCKPDCSLLQEETSESD